ncbi:DUF1365 domain-containing protein [Pseudomonas sp. FW215-R2]|uniref:DUF1365 domain-containing protein n=1 Tax=unclassified Pseudomonas TaxID=196821 RepID=UPI000C8860F1|nr:MULTISPECIES: DUF1365 domain-containing protein [unclassified Pseudomonas]PMW98030.1 DUF1365 domain-containing protein [Pseudomonas sp. FW215-R2]PMX08518.1 DUF1365 domain-containing protein [Pseudomonas sp. FW215-L1]PMX21885.1 DUF1365 domain-containing protein [Pseudomonas sp. FW215-E1]PNA28676.1 DUF1365 domain-containing protein [Pseudomonas sp. FW215-R4]
MNSALYSGWIAHRRFAPRRHEFRYRIGLIYLDLTEQDAVLNLSFLAGANRFAPFSFRETDYLKTFTGRGVRLIDAVRLLVGEALGHEPQGSICLLTQPRSWGLAFNPVSFFYCHEADGQLAAILCEVSNTPWRERYHYVLPAQAPTNVRDFHQHFAVAKAFHVSPFLPPDLEYRMSFSPAAQTLGVHMADWQGEQKLFDATLNLKREPLDRRNLHRHLWRFPWMTAKTALAIYWQALRLLLKRTPLFPHRTADDSFRTATASPEEHRHEIL